MHLQTILVVALSALFGSISLHAQFVHPRHVISGAGGRMTSANAIVQGTLTQTAIGYLGGPDSVAHVGFWYPVRVTREIDSTNVVFALPQVRAKTGDIIDVPIRQERGRWLNGRKPASVTFNISFNGSVLQPLSPMTSCPASGFCTVVVGAVPLTSEGVVATIRCRVKLGDAEVTPLHISQVLWPPDSRVRTEVRHGDLLITNICHEGDSTRLIIAGEATRLLPPRPMPAASIIDVDYALAGRSDVSVAIVDAVGAEVSKILQTTQSYGSYSVRHDVSSLPAGTYFVVLRSDDGLFMQPLVIAR